MLTNAARTAIFNKANYLVKTDKEVNGDTFNAPYRILHDGEKYVVKIKHRDVKRDGDVVSVPYIVIVRPEAFICSFELLQAQSSDFIEELMANEG